MKPKRMTWRELQAVDPQILDSWWSFARRGDGGDGRFHGNCIPQVVLNTSLRYTMPGDIAWDPMCGSGTAPDVWDTLGVNGVGSDLVPVREKDFRANALNARLWYTERTVPKSGGLCVFDGIPELFECETGHPVQTNFLFMHPPYGDIVTFNDGNPDDLSTITDMDEFTTTMGLVVANLASQVAPNGYVVLLCGDIYKDSAVYPLSNLMMEQWRCLPEFVLKNHIVKNIAGNRFNAQRDNLYYSRHARFDTSKFKHEDIWVFRKE